MKRFSIYFALLVCCFLFSCDEDSTCVICTLNTTETEVCEWDETSVTIGEPGAVAAQIFENTSVAAEVATLEAAGYTCNQ
jgi:hypothetical protein